MNQSARSPGSKQRLRLEMGSFRLKSIAGFLILLYISYFLVASSLDFLRIFSSPHSGIAWSQTAIKNIYLNHTAASQEKLVIPRKIHQIYHDWSGSGGNVPHAVQWARLKDSCINRNPGWEYKVCLLALNRYGCVAVIEWQLTIGNSCGAQQNLENFCSESTRGFCQLTIAIGILCNEWMP